MILNSCRNSSQLVTRPDDGSVLRTETSASNPAIHSAHIQTRFNPEITIVLLFIINFHTSDHFLNLCFSFICYVADVEATAHCSQFVCRGGHDRVTKKSLSSRLLYTKLSVSCNTRIISLIWTIRSCEKCLRFYTIVVFPLIQMFDCYIIN